MLVQVRITFWKGDAWHRPYGFVCPVVAMPCIALYGQSSKENTMFRWLTSLLATEGIDVSHYQSNIDWAAVRKAGKRFTFIKATEGTSYVDPLFKQNWNGSREAGLLRGAYHFFKANQSVAQQVENFCNAVGSLEADDLPPVLDVEADKGWSGLSTKEAADRTIEWLTGVESRLGVAPIVYLSPSFARDTLGSDPRLARYRLWIANYVSGGPTIPKPWSTYLFWQYSEKGRCPGIPGSDVDLDRYNGVMASRVWLRFTFRVRSVWRRFF